METNFTGQPNQEDMGNQQDNQPIPDSIPEMHASAGETGTDPKRKRHHEDHHVSRKYRLFSNHSSYGDSPHTNTSF